LRFRSASQFRIIAELLPTLFLDETENLNDRTYSEHKALLLSLDELGYVPFSKTGAGILPEVISCAYERQSLMVTPNFLFESWTEVIGSERLTGALLDRFAHGLHIEANGQSYRLGHAKKRASRQPKDTQPGN
jgi:DNA replication protein DnaC